MRVDRESAIRLIEDCIKYGDIVCNNDDFNAAIDVLVKESRIGLDYRKKVTWIKEIVCENKVSNDDKIDRIKFILDN